MIVFIFVILAILFVANAVVYEALLVLFKIQGQSYILISILGILVVSFIASIFLGKKNYNIFTRTYSIISMTWMGMFGYFFIASVIYILEYVSVGDPQRIIGSVLFGLATFVGIYGMVHAFNIKIKKVEVILPNISEVWKQRKVVWMSDLHIGQIHGKRYVRRVVEKIKKISPDILFIGGDLFDGSSAPEILESISAFSELSIPLGIFFVMGNHEGYGISEIFQKKIREVGIQVLNNKKIDIDGLQIIGVDYTSTTKADAFKVILKNLGLDTTKPSILLKHEPKHVDVAEQAGVSLQISGHTHKAQQWPFEYVARMTYGKFRYGLQQLNSLQVFTSSGTGTWGPPLRVGTDCEIIIFSLVSYTIKK